MPALGFRPLFFLYTHCLQDLFSHLGGYNFLNRFRELQTEGGKHTQKLVTIIADIRENIIAATRRSKGVLS